jgi:predicted membrane channel-forming protein YqfA (hemolysin III family)
MTLTIFIILALAIVCLSLYLTTRNKKNRIITGVFLILSVLTYPLFLPLLHEIKVLQGLDGTATLMLFYFIILIGGITTIIAGLFTNRLGKG